MTVYVELSRPDWLATVQSGRKQVQSRACTPSFTSSGLVVAEAEAATVAVAVSALAFVAAMAEV